MNFDWHDFLQLARALTDAPAHPGPPEAAYRSAASRAYYAAYHSALQNAIPKGFTPSSTGDDHRKLPNYYRHNTLPQDLRRKLAQELERLLALRLKADYHRQLDRTPESLAKQAIGMAQRVLGYLAALQ